MNPNTLKKIHSDKTGRPCYNDYYKLGSGIIEEETTPHFRRAVSFREYVR
jgi:hypothetical protein